MVNLLTVVEGNLAIATTRPDSLVMWRPQEGLPRQGIWKKRLTRRFCRQAGLVRHHRLPSSQGGKNNRRNISYLAPLLHWAWHLLFGNWLAERIVAKMTECYIEPDVTLFVMRDGEITYPVMPPGVTILIVKDGRVVESLEDLVAV